MQPVITLPETTPPVDRGYAVSMVIDTFRGYQDVEVHLFRPDWPEGEMEQYDWESLLGNPVKRGQEVDPLGSRKVLLETFTKKESDELLSYLRQRYESRLSSITVTVLSFPIPLGLVPLSEMEPGQTIGLVELEKIPSYPLAFPVHGLFDLRRHEPKSQEE